MTNKVKLAGEVISTPTIYFESETSVGYEFILRTKRLSDTEDTINIRVEKEILGDITLGDWVALEGSYQSYFKTIDGKDRLQLAVNTRSMRRTDNKEYINKIELEGLICKPVISRVTPFGKNIADIMLVVTRPHRIDRKFDKHDYIPTIVWGTLVKSVQDKKVGNSIHLEGRIQSRIYTKDEKEYTVNEISVNSLKI